MSTLEPAPLAPLPWGAAGFIGPPATGSLVCRIFAAGHETETDTRYSWDGLTREDGPLYLFQYTLAGQGALDLNGSIQRIMPGQLMLLPIPGNHRYFLPTDSASWEFAWLLVRQENLVAFWKDIQAFWGPVASLETVSPVIRCFLDLVTRVLTDTSGDAWQRSSLVYRLFMELLSRGAARRQDPPPDMPPGISRVLAALERDFRSVDDLDSMAKLSVMSRYHFLRQFRQHTGLTPGEYLTRLRMARAMDLLQSGTLELAGVARLCGYNSASYFIKVFKQQTGLTPGAFRSGNTSLPGSRIHWQS